MKIIICGSISKTKEIHEARDVLVKMGHEVEIPQGCKVEYLRGRTEVSESEKAKDKIENDLIKGYYEKIKKYDALLVINPGKKGIKNYIGGNTFLEMGFGHVLEKPVYILNDIPEISYKSEIVAMQPIVLKGDLSKIGHAN